MRKTRRAQRAITLIELVVAMVIMSVVSVGSYALFELVQQAQNRISLKEARLTELQRSMHWMLEDIQHMVARAVVDEFGGLIPALDGQFNRLAFTRNGVLRVDLSRFVAPDADTLGNPWASGQPWESRPSDLARVAYQLEEQTLVRSQWLALDRSLDPKYESSPLLQSVTRLEFRFLEQRANSAAQWITQWPPQATGANQTVAQGTGQGTAQGTQVDRNLPRVVEVNLEVEGVGLVQRWIQVNADWPESTELDRGIAPPQPQSSGSQPSTSTTNSSNTPNPNTGTGGATGNDPR